MKRYRDVHKPAPATLCYPVYSLPSAAWERTRAGSRSSPSAPGSPQIKDNESAVDVQFVRGPEMWTRAFDFAAPRALPKE
eukprot:131874-Rhodomonas_salina.1